MQLTIGAGSAFGIGGAANILNSTTAQARPPVLTGSGNDASWVLGGDFSDTLFANGGGVPVILPSVNPSSSSDVVLKKLELGL